MKIKIFIVIDSLGPGGTQRQVIEYLKQVNRQKFSIKVISLHKEYDTLQSEIKNLGYDVVGLKQGGMLNVGLLFKLVSLFRKEKPDIVHTFLFTSDFYGRSAARLAGVKHIIRSVRNIDQWKKPLHIVVDRFLNQATAIVTINAEIIRPYLKTIERLSDAKIVTIYNGIDLSRFENLKPAQEIRKEFGIQANALVVAMVSRFSEQKDYETFFKAAEIMLGAQGQSPKSGDSPLFFLAVGDGPQRKEIEAQYSRLNTQYIKFTGLRKDIPDLINAMDICVLSSHYEGLPNVIMEYMACSKPVIATRVGGCPELVVEGKTGYLVPPKNPKALADKIVALLKDKTLRVVMGRAGRKRVEDLFTSQRMAQETEQLYESLVQPRIAYILSQFPETHETFILREIRALKQKQVGIKILSMKPCRDKVIHDEARELIGETVYGHVNVLSIVYCVLRKPIRTFRALLYIFKTYGKNPKELIKALYVLFECFYFLRVIKKENIRHIHSHWATMPTTAAMVLSKLTGIPFSFTAHAWDIFVNPDGLDEKIKRARCVVTCTDYNRRFLTYFCKNGEQNKIHLNYHGIEIASVASLPRNDTLNENLGTVPKKRGQSLRILAIGRLVETKGFEYLIEACKILKDKEIPFECKIVGEGPLRRSLHAAAVSLKLRDKIKFLGIQTQGQIKQLFSEATMLVQPSVMARNGDRDGIPNVILEALAYGVPVIATNFSGIPEAVIHAKTGILVPDRDSSALANAIIELHNDCYLTDKLINEARTLVEERFNTQRNVEELIGIFQKYNII